MYQLIQLKMSEKLLNGKLNLVADCEDSKLRTQVSTTKLTTKGQERCKKLWCSLFNLKRVFVGNSLQCRYFLLPLVKETFNLRS